MPAPTRAAVVNGIVTTCVLMDNDMYALYEEYGFLEMMWPGANLIDITDVVPQPSISWSYDPEDEGWPWKWPSPGAGYVWDRVNGGWIEPEPVLDEPQPDDSVEINP